MGRGGLYAAREAQRAAATGGRRVAPCEPPRFALSSDLQRRRAYLHRTTPGDGVNLNAVRVAAARPRGSAVSRARARLWQGPAEGRTAQEALCELAEAAKPTTPRGRKAEKERRPRSQATGAARVARKEERPSSS